MTNTLYVDYNIILLLIYLQVGDRQVGIIYPPVTSVSVELSESNDIICSDMTVITNCIGEIKDRDDYTVITTQNNNIGSTMYTDILDGQ